MKKRKLMMLLLALIPLQTYATSGRLSGSSITQCNGNYYGQHGDGHWHIAVKRGNYWYPDGTALSGNPCQNDSSNSNYTAPTPIITKNSDVSLKEIKVDSTVLNISDNMEYTTKSSQVSIDATTNDSKAKVEILGEYTNLSVGDNNIVIKVTAEDSTTKEYKLNIYKLSNNTKATVKYENKEIKFTNNKSETIKVKSDIIKLTVTPEDEKAKTNIEESYNLKNGMNKIKLSVTAEDGENKIYTVNVYKESSNTNATIKYNKKEIKFTDNKSKKITVKKKKISLNVSLEDNKAKSNVKKSYKLKKGNNKIKITVTAEDGSKKDYIINVYRKKSLF